MALGPLDYKKPRPKPKPRPRPKRNGTSNLPEGYLLSAVNLPAPCSIPKIGGHVTHHQADIWIAHGMIHVRRIGDPAIYATSLIGAVLVYQPDPDYQPEDEPSE